MMRSRLVAQRLAALFLLGCLLFTFPLLALFNRDGEVLGIPLLYAYIFGAWLVLIALMALAAERRGRR
jgi:predicted permease